jgi:hypothetical protein
VGESLEQLPGLQGVDFLQNLNGPQLTKMLGR